ncbi:MAG: hypothetical protein QOH29_147 [Actinomycetota bacterium]|nr:hypothetical protein [Actinomycetota bacterium]
MWRSLSVVLLLTLAGCAAGQQAASPPSTASTGVAPASSDLPSPAASPPLASSSAPTVAPPRPTHSPSARSSSPARGPDPAGAACSVDNVYTHKIGQSITDAASLGDSVATLTGTAVDAYGEPGGVSGGRIVVKTAGQTVVSAPVDALTMDSPPATAPPELFDFVFNDASPDKVRGPLCLVRFAAGGPVVALLVMTTGGAHCCGVVRAYVAPGNGATSAVTTKPIEHDFRNAFPTVGADGGQQVLVSADDAFNYAFGSFADSAAPVSLYTVQAGAFVNVTSAHPVLIRADADQQWKRFIDPSTNPGAVISSLAAWVADQCMLGNASSAWQTVAKFNALGRLASPDTGYARGDAYVSDLEIFLADHHYCAPVGAAAATPRPSFSGFDPAVTPPTSSLSS